MSLTLTVDGPRWRAHLERSGVETWVARLAGEPIGYAELVREGGDVEVGRASCRERV